MWEIIGGIGLTILIIVIIKIWFDETGGKFKPL